VLSGVTVPGATGSILFFEQEKKNKVRDNKATDLIDKILSNLTHKKLMNCLNITRADPKEI